jgi:hypothetical protein
MLSEIFDENGFLSRGDRESIGQFPYYTAGGNWETLSSTDWDDWVAGFWPGLWWMGTGVDNRYETRARALTSEVELTLTDNFNVGFRQQYSWVAEYEATGTSRSETRARKAVDHLLDCYHPPTELIVHRGNGTVTVSATDAMMNLPLLMWGYRRNHRPVRCRWVIERTIDRARDLFIRERGGVHHLIEFDRRTGRPLSIQSPQGYPNGCWSRGLSWMVAGLTLGGLCLNRSDWLRDAKGLIAYHWNESDGPIPPYDYDARASESPVPTDTSAGAILASAMLLIGMGNSEASFTRPGETIVDELLNDFLRETGSDGLIGGGSFHVPARAGVNEATVWGDFYTIESLYLKEKQTLPPHLNWLSAA